MAKEEEIRTIANVSSDEKGDTPLARLAEALNKRPRSELDSTNKFAAIINALLSKCNKPDLTSKDRNLMNAARLVLENKDPEQPLLAWASAPAGENDRKHKDPPSTRPVKGEKKCLKDSRGSQRGGRSLRGFRSYGGKTRAE